MIQKFRRFSRLLGIGLLLFCIDVVIKYFTFIKISKMGWATASFPYGGIGIFHDFYGISFSLNYVENMGAAWGAFSSYSNVLFYLRIVIASILLLYMMFVNRDSTRTIPFLMIITGAAGNIFDVITYGHVIDMFHLNFWGYSYPVFNFADSLISIGITCLIFKSLFSKKRSVQPVFDSFDGMDS
jgi:signal peptidase II